MGWVWSSRFFCEVLLSNQDDWSRYAVGRGPTEPTYGVANELWARAVIGGEWGPIGPINMEKVKTIIAYPMGAQSISNTNPAVVSFGLQPYYYRSGDHATITAPKHPSVDGKTVWLGGRVDGWDFQIDLDLSQLPEPISGEDVSFSLITQEFEELTPPPSGKVKFKEDDPYKFVPGDIAAISDSDNSELNHRCIVFTWDQNSQALSYIFAEGMEPPIFDRPLNGGMLTRLYYPD